ncbi:superantigen-like protein SSL12 [Staphylococcus aureus]|nr:superantigen-like protein SSL12 [Staphylococcus aureus]HCZ5750077.1 superantigen-like protein SSL12 [Staphylococcus aureus]HCZ5779485.1 superantigen-like protein SSL12 [Staphylococcus aureus]HDA6454250.1 superantigen-like protein SSL12 [Staphylococcus aureus]
MKKNITNKIVLSTALLLLGTTSTQPPKAPISFSSEAKAYNISENETNINELIKYYTQPHLSFSGKWLWQNPNGTIHATLQTWVWYTHIQVFGPESWGNVNQLRDRYVDVFGLKDEDTSQLWWVYRDTFTGGVTPAASPSDKPYSLFVQYKDKLQTIIGAHKMYQGNKPILTLKEIDFRARETLIKNKILYHENRNKGKLKITGGGNDFTIDLSKRLHSDLANVYVKNPQKITVEVLID